LALHSALLIRELCRSKAWVCEANKQHRFVISAVFMAAKIGWDFADNNCVQGMTTLGAMR
ncbi:MAG: hypothetical protein DRQ64_09645, partial [Gammaproteobacteria bacterium]